MNADNLIIKLEWNDFFKKLQEYGSTFINETRASVLSNRVGDSHTIIYRTVENFPEWIVNQFTLKIQVIQVFAILPKSIGMTHKDGLKRKAAFNIPLMGADLGYMDWFDLDIKERKIDTEYSQVRLIEDEKSHNPYRIENVPKYRCRIDKPSLVNTDIWHRIDNSDNKNFRYMLSMRFENNPSFEELKTFIDKFRL